ncbi:MAG: hypothetical protein UGF89_06610 [Acutalibacteraceae bacterium]|nr:hypothetical protein [Acutalibacteraceae bacterium]
MEWTVDNGYYVTTIKDIKVKIKKGNLTSATHNCCFKVTKLYEEYKDKIIENVNAKLLKSGKVYDKGVLAEKMGTPEVEILAKGNDAIIWFVFFIDDKKVVCEYEENMYLLGVKIWDEAVTD